jgi:hypothetical protein
VRKRQRSDDLAYTKSRGRRSEAPLPANASGADHLRAAFGRLVRVAKAQPRPREPGDDDPSGNWENRTDERLQAIEQKLASQNRLLLLSAVAIVADATIKVFHL